MALIPTFLRGILGVCASSKELTQMEKKLNDALTENFDCDKETFIKSTSFVPKMQTRVNQMLKVKDSIDIDNINRVAELSVLLDKLQSYRTEDNDNLKLIIKNVKGRSLLNFTIVRVGNLSLPSSPESFAAAPVKKPRDTILTTSMTKKQ